MAAELTDGLSTPLPSPELMIAVSGHADTANWAVSRRPAVDLILGYLNSAGIPFRGTESILDLGCGCGRILAGWEGRLQSAKLYGADINPSLVEFCQKNIPFAETIVSTVTPPLPYADSQFDLVYCASVFTHLSRSNTIDWVKELARIIRPGGTLIASFHGKFYETRLAEISQAGLEELHRFGSYQHSFDDAAEGSNYYASFIDLDTLPRLFREFRIVERHGGPTHFAAYQDAVVMTRY
jgi:ubiquinone/menaquinone biosynthesis C-methylase UbiE